MDKMKEMRIVHINLSGSMEEQLLLRIDFIVK